MIRIQQLKLRPDQPLNALEEKIRKELRLSKDERFTYEVVRQSIDARRKPEIFYSYIADVRISSEERILKKLKNNGHVSRISEMTFCFGHRCSTPVLSQNERPVIIGSGPAGLFCALTLAQNGFSPIVFERGENVERRQESVEHFWSGGELNEESNVQFGEGGAGTFSDGKLNTRIKDSAGRIQYVLKTFIEHGASEDILYSYKPHIGTDVLAKVIPSIRNEIIRCGGEVRFGCCVEEIRPEQDETYTLTVRTGSQRESIHTGLVILAIGHSARDTFRMLYRNGVPMTAKSFAVGIRVQHPQRMVNDAMYGKDCRYDLGPAPYAVTCKLPDGHGIYSFCMCPGGYVVNASSKKGALAVNGMSYSDRGGDNANSAIVVTVTPEDYDCSHPLDGITFQQKLEERAFAAGKGCIPLQRFGDFCRNRVTEKTGSISASCKGEYHFANLREIFPEKMNDAIETGMHQFARIIPGFDDEDVILAAVESRTSAPVRIERDETLQVPGFPGMFPCGEGGGYAGGIVSSAVDGIKVAQAAAVLIERRKCE